ncbi:MULTISPECIES: hypothetical protein [unclassified Pseudomonas]|uniref:hypothetical protein n=1 Tax=unclassified Pseudomonas TaxID=196821 RepID=UPI001CBF25F4|nr:MULTISPECIES: hypothetical protein [unclassified Pseudomonas]
MSTTANKKDRFYLKRRLLTLLLLIYLVWYVTVPRVKIYFSEEGNGKMEFILNTQHDIFRGDISPGESTGGAGHLFPDDDFFMRLDWTASNKSHCVMISPSWPTTSIYIAADGVLDKSPSSGTDSDRLKQCITDTASP